MSLMSHKCIPARGLILSLNWKDFSDVFKIILLVMIRVGSYLIFLRYITALHFSAFLNLCFTPGVVWFPNLFYHKLQVGSCFL